MEDICPIRLWLRWSRYFPHQYRDGAQHIRRVRQSRRLELAGLSLRNEGPEWNGACDGTLCPTQEVNHETQSSFVELERTRHRGVLQAGIHFAQCARGFDSDGPGRACRFDVDHAASGPDQPHHSAAGQHDTAACRLDHSAEVTKVTSFPVPLPLPAPLPRGRVYFQQE